MELWYYQISEPRKDVLLIRAFSTKVLVLTDTLMKKIRTMPVEKHDFVWRDSWNPIAIFGVFATSVVWCKDQRGLFSRNFLYEDKVSDWNLVRSEKRLSSRGTGFPLTKGLEIKKTIWIHWSIRRWNQNKMFFKWTNLNVFETFGGGLELGHEHYSNGAKLVWLSDVIRSFFFFRTTEPSKSLYKDPKTGCFNWILT